MPTGVLMPVASMSSRVLMGMVQALVRPGNWTMASSSLITSSMVLPSGQASVSVRMIVVSNMDSGAGSVAVPARPDLPSTWATCGWLAMIRSVCWSSSRAFVIEMPGGVVGM